MQMRFKWKGLTMVLQRDSALSRSMVSLKSIAKVVEMEFGGTV